MPKKLNDSISNSSSTSTDSLNDSEHNLEYDGTSSTSADSLDDSDDPESPEISARNNSKGLDENTASAGYHAANSAFTTSPRPELPSAIRKSNPIVSAASFSPQVVTGRKRGRSRKAVLDPRATKQIRMSFTTEFPRPSTPAMQDTSKSCTQTEREVEDLRNKVIELEKAVQMMTNVYDRYRQEYIEMETRHNTLEYNVRTKDGVIKALMESNATLAKTFNEERRGASEKGQGIMMDGVLNSRAVFDDTREPFKERVQSWKLRWPFKSNLH